MVWRARVLSETSVAMMGSVEVTTLHPQGLGDPKLSGTKCGTVLVGGLPKGSAQIG
jgi:hypothetical protein